jgi:hypothetical protein
LPSETPNFHAEAAIDHDAETPSADSGAPNAPSSPQWTFSAHEPAAEPAHLDTGAVHEAEHDIEATPDETPPTSEPSDPARGGETRKGWWQRRFKM